MQVSWHGGRYSHDLVKSLYEHTRNIIWQNIHNDSARHILNSFIQWWFILSRKAFTCAKLFRHSPIQMKKRHLLNNNCKCHTAQKSQSKKKTSFKDFTSRSKKTTWKCLLLLMLLNLMMRSKGMWLIKYLKSFGNLKLFWNKHNTD